MLSERTVAKMATPKAPEMFRAKAKIDDAIPTSCKGTVEVAAFVKSSGNKIKN